MDTSISDDNWGKWHDLMFHNGYFDYRRTFRTVFLFVLLCNWVNIAVMDTSPN